MTLVLIRDNLTLNDALGEGRCTTFSPFSKLAERLGPRIGEGDDYLPALTRSGQTCEQLVLFCGHGAAYEQVFHISHAQVCRLNPLQRLKGYRCSLLCYCLPLVRQLAALLFAQQWAGGLPVCVASTGCVPDGGARDAEVACCLLRVPAIDGEGIQDQVLVCDCGNSPIDKLLDGCIKMSDSVATVEIGDRRLAR